MGPSEASRWRLARSLPFAALAAAGAQPWSNGDRGDSGKPLSWTKPSKIRLIAVEGTPAGRLPGQQRIVTVHQAKTHLSRLIDAAHGGETILLAKAGKPWARLAPLESEAPLRVTGRLRHLGSRSQPDLLLEPITPEELADWESAPAGPLEDGSLEDRSLAALE